MRTYYIHENGQQVGPFTIQELKSKSINSQTPVWTDGMSQWLEAGNIEELKAIVIKTPPLYKEQVFPTSSTEGFSSAFKEAFEEKSPNKAKTMVLVGILLLIILIASFIIYQNSSNKSYTTPST